LHDREVAANSLGADQNGGAITRAPDNVGLPLSGHFATRTGQMAREFALSK